MTKYKEILKYRFLGYSQRQTADILGTSRNTISKVIPAAESVDLDWVSASSLNETEITNLLFPKKPKESMYLQPDCNYLHQELQKKGVTLSLLWKEYVTECSVTDQMRLGYSQFCTYYRKYQSNYA